MSNRLVMHQDIEIRKIALDRALSFTSRTSSSAYLNSQLASRATAGEVLVTAKRFYDFLLEGLNPKAKIDATMVIKSEPVAVSDSKPTINKN